MVPEWCSSAFGFWILDFGFSILDVASKSGSQKWIQILILDVAKIQMQNVDFGIKSWMSAQILDLENGS